MRNLIIIAFISSFFILSCNNNPSGAHTHDDGTTHSDHKHEQSADEKPDQEIFDVEQDSTGNSEHGHSHGKDDSHGHEHAH